MMRNNKNEKKKVSEMINKRKEICLGGKRLSQEIKKLKSNSQKAKLCLKFNFENKLTRKEQKWSKLITKTPYQVKFFLTLSKTLLCH